MSPKWVDQGGAVLEVGSLWGLGRISDSARRAVGFRSTGLVRSEDGFVPLEKPLRIGVVGGKILVGVETVWVGA